MRSVNVYLVRHGETEENKTGIIQGQLNTQLNEAGRDQAHILAEVLKGVSFNYAFTSDLSRAADTARTVMQHHPSVKLIETPALRERYLGSRQGMRRGSKHSKDESSTMEPRGEFHARLREWWNESIVPLCTDLASASSASASTTSKPSETQPLMVLAVSHAASIATLVLTILIDRERYTSLVEMDSRRLYNTSITEVQFRVRKDETGTEMVLPVITRFGDVDHLLRPNAGGKKKRDVERANADLEEGV